MSNGKRMGYSFKELNQTHLLDFLKTTRIHFGISPNKNINNSKVKDADQNDIDNLLS